MAEALLGLATDKLPLPRNHGAGADAAVIKGGSSRSNGRTSKGTGRSLPPDQSGESDEIIPELTEDGPKNYLADESFTPRQEDEEAVQEQGEKLQTSSYGSAVEGVEETQEVESPNPPGIDVEPSHSKHLNERVAARGTPVGESQKGAAAGKPESAFNGYADEANDLSALDAPAAASPSCCSSSSVTDMSSSSSRSSGLETSSYSDSDSSSLSMAPHE